MKIVLKDSMNVNFDEICIYYNSMNKTAANHLSYLLKQRLNAVEVIDKKYERKIEFLHKIYYIEIKNQKVICYFENNNKIMNIKNIKNIYDKLHQCGFIKINKTTLVNMNYIKNYKIIENSQRLIELNNDVQLIVSRKYKNIFDTEYKYKKI